MEDNMEFNEIMETRRSVNYFDPAKLVSEETLKKIVTLATLTPSSFNLQPWNLIVVRSPEDKARLRKLAMDQPKVTEAAAVLIVLADKDGYKESNPTVEAVWKSWQSNGYMKPEQREWFMNACRNLYGGAETNSLAFAVKNAAFFAMSIMFAAKEFGLDSHPMDGFDREAVKKEFAISDNFFLPVLITLGHFDQSKKLLPRNWRKSYEEIVLKTL
jgi:nitroreductase